MAEPLSPQTKRVAIVVVVGAIMSILDTTIVNVALESLSHDLHAPLSTVQWVSTGYLLALATVIPLTGWAAENYGPRRVWMTVVTGFVITSGLCGLAWSAESLIAFRVLQGLAGGMIMPIVDRTGLHSGDSEEGTGRSPLLTFSVIHLQDMTDMKTWFGRR